MYLLVAGSLSVFAACGGACSADCAKECCAVEEVVACADDCQKACCLGCKATEGEASCHLLAADDHSCCVVKEDAPHTHEGDSLGLGDHPHPH